MKILFSKLPLSGWCQNGIPKYEDNPAMIEGAIPNLNLLNKERKNLISIIKDNGHEVIEINFPKKLDGKNCKHDFVFIRDPFISDQNGTAIILRAGEQSRRVENFIVKSLLEKLGMKIKEIPDHTGIRADGGEFYYCAKEKILFSGLQRNTEAGINYVADMINAKKVIILKGDGYHLDTFFSPCLDKNGKIIALIVCKSILNDDSKKRLDEFAYSENILMFDIPIHDAIGTNEKLGTFSVNCLPLPGLLIRPNYFSDPSIDKKLNSIGIKVIISTMSQFQLSGGSIHCVTNEL